MICELICLDELTLWYVSGIYAFGILVVGSIVGALVTKGLRSWTGVQKPAPTVGRVSPLLLGNLERTVIFVLILAGPPSDLLTACIAWLALKLAVNWQRYTAKEGETEQARHNTNAMIALTSGFISLAIGAASGYAAKCIVFP